MVWQFGGWVVWGLKMALKILFQSKSTLYNPVGVDARVVHWPQAAAIVVQALQAWGL
jgi:hypothetical protein